MKIGLIDVDGHKFPNLALMKISAWHKNNGDHVEFVNPMEYYNKVYMAKVFSFTADYKTVIRADEIIKGGTGYNLKTELPEEIENIYPDYSLYNTKIAYGFLTRGCPRNCNFCIVSKKEGNYSYKASDLENFWNGQKEIKLLDPNLLACNHHLVLLNQLVKSKAYIDFTQGLDCRLLTEQNIKKILQCKIKMLHFAWDKQKDEDLIIRKLELFNNYSKLSNRNKRVYVLVNFDTNFEYDLYRVETLKKLQYDPYIMIYDKQNAKLKYRKLQRYVNSKFIFYSETAKNFSEYTKIATIKNKAYKNQISLI